MTVNEANHWLFQLANTCLLLSYSTKDILLLRIFLMGAGIFFVLWGSLILHVSIDTVIWNSIFTIINGCRAIEVAWSRRPIQFTRQEHDIIYQQVFGPVGINRLEFKLMIEEGLLRKLRSGTTFIEAGNEASNLTLIIDGTMDVISSPKDGRPPEKVGKLNPMQFIESPQWANMEVQRRGLYLHNHHHRSTSMTTTTASNKQKQKRQSSIRKSTLRDNNDNNIDIDIVVDDEENQNQNINLLVDDTERCDKIMRVASNVDVTIKASTDVVFVSWPMERLREFMRKNPNVTAPINAVIGSDVASKLFTQSKGGSSNGGGVVVSGGGEEISSTGSIMMQQRRIYLPMDEPTTIIESAILPSSTSCIKGDDGGGDKNIILDDESSSSKKDVVSKSITKDDENDDNNNEENVTSTKIPCHTSADDDSDDEAETEVVKVVSSSTIEKNPLHAEQLWLQRRGMKDTSYDKKLEKILNKRTNLNKYEISALLSKGKWRYILQKSTILIREGEFVPFVGIVLEGKFSVSKGGGGGEGKEEEQDDGNNNKSSIRQKRRQILHTIYPGQFIGSIEFNEPERNHIAGETVTSLCPSTYIVWDLDDLRVLLKPRPRLRAQFTTLIATDLSEKFRQAVA